MWGILKSMPSALTKKELASLLNLLDGDARPIDTVRVCLCVCVCLYIYTHMYNLKKLEPFYSIPFLSKGFPRTIDTARFSNP